MTFQPEFLTAREDCLPWQLPEGGRAGFTSGCLFVGKGQYGIEVVTAYTDKRPNVSDVRTLWKRRHGGRPSPVLLVVLYPEKGEIKAAVCGPVGEDPPVLAQLDPGQAERIADAALAEPNKHVAIRFLHSVLPEAETELPGVRNVGMFANHELRSGVPAREDWPSARDQAKPLLALRGQELIRALGYTVEQHSTTTSLLKAGGKKRVVAVFLEEKETPEGPSQRFGGLSPVSQALAVADAEGLPYVIVTRGSQIRVYAAGTEVGVGRKGRANTFIELHLALLPDENAGYLPLIFGAEALLPDGTFEQILGESKRFATDLGTRLRDRVYVDMVPALATAVSRHYEVSEDNAEADLDFIYEGVLTILFRLLFIAYAEDKDLLPFRSNGVYRRHALKTLAQELADHGGDGFDTEATNMWSELKLLFRAIESGNRDWGVPPYDGGLFTAERDVSEVGNELSDLVLTNAQIGPAVRALLVDQDESGVLGPVDFRSLSVREFGTIYEGLLESSLSVAPSELTIDNDGQWVPAKKGDQVEVGDGDIYLHNRSGARKSSGSYFTKPFAVEHLLDHALEPALDDHIERLDRLVADGEESEAADAFFDFRCADIAMGSGHFLVAAVDRIEARLSGFLAREPLTKVIAELERLRESAIEALGDLAEGVEIEHASLLRRQVARRCVYGVDINPIAVELARLAIWIHTFVPGLPLSFLDHSVVQGNSLTGIGTIDEAVEILDPAAADGTVSIFRAQIEAFLERAREDLRRLARISEATMKEIREARQAQVDAEKAIEPAAQLFDLLVAVRLGEVDAFTDISEEKILKHKGRTTSRELAEALQPLHFPIVFPEVFLRDRPGFDCILGNPPWEKVKVEEHGFWALRFPGLRSLSVHEQGREIARLETAHADLVAEYEREVEETSWLRGVLVKGPYPGMGSGDPDLYKAFAWRFWDLIRECGLIGVVLPRSALAASGSTMWREALLESGAFEDATMLLNTGNWAFDDMEPRYTIGLLSIRKAPAGEGTVSLRGPFASRAAFEAGHLLQPLVVKASELRTWTTGAAFPLLPSPEAGEVFLKLRRHPRFDDHAHSWRFRPLRELDATNDKHHMVLDPSDVADLWPVYKGASFNLWEPDTGEYYAWAESQYIADLLQKKRIGQHRHARSAFFELDDKVIMDPKTLPCLHPRIAFRDVARATDTRTMIAALIPPEVLVNHKAPYLVRIHGSARDESFLLGILGSIPLDWYARRVVEITMSFDLLNSFPIPVMTSSATVDRVIEIAGRLAASDERFASWAAEVNVPVGSVSTKSERDDLLAELDARVALLYGLDEADVALIFETFHPTWDYQGRLDAVQAHFTRLWSST